MAAKDETDKTTEIMAAVGAGMLPATMAMLMPMVLGRRKRDTSQLLSQLFLRNFQPHHFQSELQRILLNDDGRSSGFM